MAGKSSKRNHTEAAQWEDDAVILDPDSYSDYNEDNILPQSAEDISKIRKWLQPTVYEGNDSEYSRHLTSHLEGTGQWLPESDAYKKWHTSDELGLLWIRGIPGSGKSVFSAALVDQLRREGAPVLYFFFRQIIDANHSPIAALRDWLDQALAYSPPLQLKLKEYVGDGRNKNGRSLESLSAADLWSHLRTAVIHIPRVYLVVDALDEMDRGDDTSTFIKALAELAQWRPSQFKIIITSRPVEYIETPLRMTKAAHIRLEERLVDIDIATYVQHRLSTSNIPENQHKLVIDAVPGRANGLFLFAKLAMDEFITPGANIHQVLQTLPADLNFMYTDLLQEHARRTKIPEHLQLLILQLVTHANRPLRLLELAQVINVTQYPEELRYLKAAKDLVRSACGPLLEILPNETVCIVHHSLTEFLTGSTRTAGEHSYPILEFGPTHERLALLCLSYLVTTGLPKAQGFGNMDLPGFTRYAGANWYIHASKAASAGVDQSEVNKILDTLFDEEHLGKLVSLSGKHTCLDRSNSFTPLFIAISFGLHDYAKLLLSRLGTEVGLVPGMRTPPLAYAAEHGYADIVELLLQHGADPSVPDDADFLRYTPLHYAASHNHAHIATLLLKAGVDPFITNSAHDYVDNNHDTAPGIACAYGHIEVVKVFLPFIKTASQANALMYRAVSNSRVEVIELLAKHPLVTINSDQDTKSLLMVASGNRNVETMRCLLALGADPKYRFHPNTCFGREDGGETLLHAWAAHAKFRYSDPETLSTPAAVEAAKDSFHLLIEAGISINDPDSDGNTPLHHAADSVAVKLLIDAGADPIAVNRRKETPLHGYHDKEMVQLLVDEITRLSLTSSTNFESPILSFLQTNKAEMALMLLETGMNAHVVDWQGRGAFHHVAKMEKPSNTTEDLRPRLIQELLKSGLDINLRDKQGKTPMHIYVSEYRHSSDPNDTLFSALEAAGADLKAKDPDGMTPLFVRFVHKPSYTKEAIELCEKVLAYEGALEMKDYQGRGLLHAASEDSDPEFIKWLVSQGVDTKATDFDGHTPFHHAVRKTKKFRRYSAASLNGILDVLIEVGIDPFQPNRFGRTPLHSVSAAKNPDAFNYVLKLYEDVNQTDHAGVTPLHLAATFSEYHTKRLLEAGADPSMATHEGMTALHLAARNRQPNILGLLLESLESRVGRDKTKPVLEAMVQFNTAMYYACASGMIESVRLLLEAGASVRSDSFLHQGLHGCRDFETEQRNWPSGGHTDSENERNTPDAGSVSVDDNHRTWKKQDGRYPFTRLDEILALIASESSLEPKQIGYAITYAASKGHDYTVDCMLRIRSQLAPEEPLKHTHESIASIARWGAMRGNYKKRENPVEVLRDDILTDSLSSFDFLMSVREYELAGDRLAHIECVTPRRYDDRSIMAEMIDGGFSSMLKRMLTPQILSRLENAEGTEETSSGHRNGLPESPEPPLVSACHRESPNMDVITLLVEEMKVDVNGHRKLAEAKQDIYSNYVLYETALHALARGDHWWQSALGIPYLVKHGANLEARNSQGSTPLNAAIGRLAEARSLNKRAIKTLVKLGADVNSVDSRGRSCLMQAAGDSEILKLLLEHGARVGPKDLLAQIQSKNCEQLELMLQSGVDPNEQIECDTRGNKTDPTYLLDHVTTCYESREGWMIYEQMARVLLKYGADPNARYSDTTVAHKAVGSGTFASLFLELPTLEVEATDSAGMTMFLLACKKVFNGGSDSKYYGQPHMEISLPRILINRGVNIYARDNQGRNALHCLLSSDIVLKDHDLLRQLASEADLINSPDNQGQTPIHYALERYTRAVEEVNILLAAGADPWISDNKGNNVLHWAFWKGVWRELPDRQEKEVYCDILERLLELPGAEAYVNARNEAGETPIFGFMRSGEKSYSFRNRNWQSATYNPPKTPEPAFKLFDEVGVDWFVINNEGQTLLHVAADTYDDIGAVRFETLLSKGLDPKAEDSKHQTPLDIAAARGRKKILDLFQAPDRQQREQVIVDDIYEDDDL